MKITKQWYDDCVPNALAFQIELYLNKIICKLKMEQALWTLVTFRGQRSDAGHNMSMFRGNRKFCLQKNHISNGDFKLITSRMWRNDEYIVFLDQSLLILHSSRQHLATAMKKVVIFVEQGFYQSCLIWRQF